MLLSDLDKVNTLQRRLEAARKLIDALQTSVSLADRFYIEIMNKHKDTLVHLGSHDFASPLSVPQLIDALIGYTNTDMANIISQLSDLGVEIPEVKSSATNETEGDHDNFLTKEQDD